MVAETGYKKEATSGSIQIRTALGTLLEIPVPVAKSKTGDAVPMMEELFSVAMKHYRSTDNINPRDVAAAMHKVADAIERYQMTITEEKYNAYKRPRPS